jgi:eukaryotic-like serine/threonine-protein kinase
VPEMIGTKLDRFELIAELASGGMGTVFLARLGGAGGFQRLYAIKRLHEHLARHAEFIEMFLDEARLAARIHHPNVVPILEIGTTDAGYYLVMEYVEGDTAGHLFYSAAQEQKPISPRVAVRIVLDALAGLHAAHEGTDDEGRSLEIVHRDVSPHNILVSVDGVSRITDFGIARAASRLAVTRTGQLKGKIAYMAPEQARSEKIDRRADVFAMGICLWEMLARRRLFKAEAEGETLNRLLYEPIPSVRSVDPEVPRELDEVCAKALTRDLDKRFATAAEFSDALENAARALDWLGSHREVASCIADVLGRDLSERRADLRAWLADTERRSLAPPAESSGDLGGAQPKGAMVSVYVPPLFDMEALRGPGAGSSAARDRRGVKGLAVVAAIGVASSLGVASWWHGHSQRVATSAPVTTFAPSPAGPAGTGVPSATTAGPEETSALATAPADSAALSAAYVARGAVASGPPVGPPTPSKPPPVVAAVARPAHVASGAARPADAASSPRPAVSVPQDMLYNPYR